MLRITLALVAAASAGAARGEPWQATSGGGNRVVVHVFRTGVLSAFAHDHHFEVTRWRASADVSGEARASVEVVLAADSLRDTQEHLSEADRRKVDAQAAGPDTLDALRYPRIEFRSEGFEADRDSSPEHLAGRLRGTLTLHGRSVPLEVSIEGRREGDEWSVRGKAHLRQSDVGIKPFSGFGGTIGVEDEIEIEVALTLRPGSP